MAGRSLTRVVGKKFNLATRGIAVQADGNSWKGRTKHITIQVFYTDLNTFHLLIGQA